MAILHAAPPDLLPLDDGRLHLTPWRDEDAAELMVAVQSSLDNLGRWLPWCTADYGLEQATAWTGYCRAAWLAGDAFAFAVRDADSGELLGGCGLNQLNCVHRSANLGYWVRTTRQRQGVAAAAARQVAQFGFSELGLIRIEIITLPDNDASRHVAEKLGAVYEGLSRQRLWLWAQAHDAAVYGLIPAGLQRAAEQTAATSS